MKYNLLLKTIMLSFGLSLLNFNAKSQDPNFFIYLCFGQSNMEGQGPIKKQDEQVNSRFKTFQAVDCANLDRTFDNWYTAEPPTCQCWSKLSPADYFGRTMIANLPDSITVGIINVAIGGCDIRLFDKDIYADYDSTYTESWFQDKLVYYGYNPYAHLIKLAKLAQHDGVIKGILLHQGETNTGDVNWPSYVKKIYTDMLADLSLEANNVPLLAGEVVHADQGGVCASMNTIIDRLPDTISTAYVIPSNGCADLEDNIHFNSDGYRELGRRYATTLLTEIMGVNFTQGSATTSLYYEAECGDVGGNWDILVDEKASNKSFITSIADIDFTTEPSNDIANSLIIPFTISEAGFYDAYARVKGSSNSQDSYWVKIDDGEFVLKEGLKTSSWEWFNIANAELSKGEHTLTIGICENNVKLDKININNYLYTLNDEGGVAENICVPDTATLGIRSISMNNYKLGQCYPNPANGLTTIKFETPVTDFVSLKVYSIFGQEIMELAGKQYNNGKYQVSFETENLSDGIYFYTLKAGNFSQSRKMVIKSK